ncbi:uncharacterized protein BO80DRAFT_255191 [Aspergillus ibericus CBS 121593]|uniref:Uncharacterized protein n=1 Tax=Aspergillus ibericus CBS 121593 TaxID=1448316 RepID=A0A395H988_9EURO|nr:hypothetical protein BO80DRAFT_255191 [Aspergillus ibericus CBS 121593]RAL04073.1 hypothetical protein BO80DRAFT_255191 [Aspergillus ibericus CBS 121593]
MKGKDEKGGGWKEKRRRGIPRARPVSGYGLVVLRSRDLRDSPRQRWVGSFPVILIGCFFCKGEIGPNDLWIYSGLESYAIDLEGAGNACLMRVRPWDSL